MQKIQAINAGVLSKCLGGRKRVRKTRRLDLRKTFSITAVLAFTVPAAPFEPPYCKMLQNDARRTTSVFSLNERIMRSNTSEVRVLGAVLAEERLATRTGTKFPSTGSN